jgi:hypothetical protein
MSGPGFGWREGYAELGSYRSGDGLGWLYAPWGERGQSLAGTVWNWIDNAGPWVAVVLLTAYAPSYVANFPVRSGLNGGETCVLPDIEAAAAVAAGIATYP